MLVYAFIVEFKYFKEYYENFIQEFMRNSYRVISKIHIMWYEKNKRGCYEKFIEGAMRNSFKVYNGMNES